MTNQVKTSPDETIKFAFDTCKICQHPIRIHGKKSPDGLIVATCRHCGLRFVSQIPTSKLWSSDEEQDTLSYYENQYQGVPDKFHYGLTLIRKFATTGKTVLDVGCGRGDFLILAQEAGFQASGLEMSRGAIALCKKRGLERIYEGDLGNAPDCYDIVTLFDVAEHVEELHGFFSALRPLIKDGGLLFIEVPRLSLLDVYLDTLSLFTPIQNNRVSREHVQLYSDKSLKNLLNHHGFKILHYETKMSLSWKDKKPYIRNLGIRWEPLVRLVEGIANVAISLGLLGRNKAIVVASKQ